MGTHIERVDRSLSFIRFAVSLGEVDISPHLYHIAVQAQLKEMYFRDYPSGYQSGLVRFTIRCLKAWRKSL